MRANDVVLYHMRILNHTRMVYVPYAYTRTVQPYAYGTENRTI